jgi:hypothetical protein
MGCRGLLCCLHNASMSAAAPISGNNGANFQKGRRQGLESTVSKPKVSYAKGLEDCPHNTRLRQKALLPVLTFALCAGFDGKVLSDVLGPTEPILRLRCDCGTTVVRRMRQRLISSGPAHSDVLSAIVTISTCRRLQAATDRRPQIE